MKKIAVGDLGEFWYGDYKEPFEQLEGGVPGHPVGVVLRADDGKLLCAFCGKTYDNLGLHAHQTHGLSSRDYKREVGLLSKAALVSERLRFGQIRRGTQRRGEMVALRAASQATYSREPWRRTGGSYRTNPEHLNKTGRCYAQVLAVGRTIMAEGRSLTRTSLGRHGIGRHTIERYFGSIEEMRVHLGQPRLLSRRGWSAEDLLNGLRGFARDHGRTPACSDLRRFGLPSEAVYIRRWGSYAEACRQAGLIPNLPMPRDGQFDIAVLSGYAATGNFRLAARMAHTSTPDVAAVFSKYGCPYSRGGRWSALRREWAGEMARRLAGDEIAA